MWIKALTDVQMTVYVDKSGRLAAMDAVTFVWIQKSFAGGWRCKTGEDRLPRRSKRRRLQTAEFCDYHRPLTANETMWPSRADRGNLRWKRNLEDSLTFSVIWRRYYRFERRNFQHLWRDENRKKKITALLSVTEKTIYLPWTWMSTVMSWRKNLHGTIDSAEFYFL